jgi:hypothetical protein
VINAPVVIPIPNSNADNRKKLWSELYSKKEPNSRALPWAESQMRIARQPQMCECVGVQVWIADTRRYSPDLAP